MTFPQAEAQVAKHLQEDLDIEYYLPMLHNRDKRYKRNQQEKPMFPCYLFAKITAKQIYSVRKVSGLISIVSTRGNGVIPVPQKDIDTVRKFEESERKFYLYESGKLVKGSSATMLDGEFAGMEGHLVKDCKDGNFCVTIESTHISFVMKVHRADIVPTDEKKSTHKKEYNI